MNITIHNILKKLRTFIKIVTYSRGNKYTLTYNFNIVYRQSLVVYITKAFGIFDYIYGLRFYVYVSDNITKPTSLRIGTFGVRGHALLV